MIIDADKQKLPKTGERYWGRGDIQGFRCTCGHVNEYSVFVIVRWDHDMPVWCRSCDKKFLFRKGIVVSMKEKNND
jgi:hypothetical protein